MDKLKVELRNNGGSWGLYFSGPGFVDPEAERLVDPREKPRVLVDHAVHRLSQGENVSFTGIYLIRTAEKTAVRVKRIFERHPELFEAGVQIAPRRRRRRNK